MLGTIFDMVNTPGARATLPVIEAAPPISTRRGRFSAGQGMGWAAQGLADTSRLEEETRRAVEPRRKTSRITDVYDGGATLRKPGVQITGNRDARRLPLRLYVYIRFSIVDYTIYRSYFVVVNLRDLRNVRSLVSRERKGV